MAHHLASAITEADAAIGDAKAVAESRAADLILRLWTRRHDLPDAVDPLGSYRNAIEVLSRLHPKQNPWRAFRGQRDVEGLLADLFNSLAKVIVGNILVAKTEESHAISSPEAAALSIEERTLLQQFAWWKAAVKPEPFQIEVFASRSSKTLDMALQVGDASVPSTDTKLQLGCEAEYDEANTVGKASEIERNPISGSPRTSDQVAEALECLQAILVRLAEARDTKPVGD